MSNGEAATPADYEAALGPVLAQPGNVMPLERAFITILAASIHADGKVRSVEIEEMEALMARITTLKGMQPEERRRVCDDIYLLVKDEKPRKDQVKLACLSVSAARSGKEFGPAPKRGIDEAIFAHACDLICSDLSIPKKEREFLRNLAIDLKIDPARAQKIMDTLRLKNRH